MFEIRKKIELVPNIYEMVVYAPQLAEKAQPGHFVIVMVNESGERIPLTVADFDRNERTITLVIMSIGTSTRKLVTMKEGDSLYALIGPLGHASEIENFGTVIMVAGGVGTAPIFPIARALKNCGNHVITIQGARNKDLLFWTDKMQAVSSEHLVMTDDGSTGQKGLVTAPLKELLEKNAQNAKKIPNEKTQNQFDGSVPPIGCIYTIGPAIMMKFCAETVRPFGIRTVASLNSVMIDGTGMCGGCRVKVGQETKFTCVDGPEFDALAVDWDIVLARHKTYHCEEKCSLQRYIEH
ncbi:MAG: sulfide/dihydroorotate dehydrogenase-like FAD/NAD-binding protein [Thermoguttaceae bacterium]